jgi:hypothetical protein
VVTPQLAGALVGGRKPVELADGVDRDAALETFIAAGHAFLAGPDRPLTPDPDRRHITRAEFVRAHLDARGRPGGHGFTAANAAAGTAYYVHDLPGVRLIGLDTTRITGAAAGAVDVDQLAWLTERLVEVHSRYRTADGREVSTSAADRLVVLFSHHGVDTLTNLRGPDLVGGPELLALLHRFDNVVLWLNGHTHTNGVTPRPSPTGDGGFWEVTTCAVVDWPCQTRLVELVALGPDTMAVVCTMVDHDSPLGVGPALDGSTLTTRQLAALHRELAANLPIVGAGSRLEGTAADRNVVLPPSP